MTKEEFKNCKVGDRVICNRNTNKYSSFLPKESEKGKIILKEKHLIRIKWENDMYEEKWNWFIGILDAEYQNVLSIDLYKPEQLEFEF